MKTKNFIKAQKDHLHFTNVCCLCHKEHDDKDMLPVWIDRPSGLDNRDYLEPDYVCVNCENKAKGES